MNLQYISHQFDRFISTNRITLDNFQSYISHAGVTAPFNELTIRCIGNDGVSLYELKHQNDGNVYPNFKFNLDDVDEAELPTKTIHVNLLFTGIQATSDMQVKYFSNFSMFISSLVALRKQLKNTNTYHYGNNRLKIFLIKWYLNSVFSMMNAPGSVLQSTTKNYHDGILDIADKIILELLHLLEINGERVLYDDIDSITIEEPKNYEKLLQTLNSQIAPDSNLARILATGISYIE